MRLVPTLLMAGSTALGSLALSAAACGTAAPTGTTVTTVFSDAYACGVGIFATASGTPDLDDLLKCGLTAVDVWNLVEKLTAHAGDGGAAAMSPAQVAWHAKLDGVKAQIRARGYDGGS